LKGVVIGSVEGFDSPSDVGEDIAIGLRTLGRARMGVVATNPTPKLQEHRGGVFICGDRRAEGQEAEILKEVVNLVEGRVAVFPGLIP
jgi:hypothetical protein